MSEIKVNKLSSRTGNAVTLGTSGDTFTIPSGVTLTNSGTATGFGSDSDISWQAIVTSNTTMVSGRGYFVDSSGGTKTMTLPASPSLGDVVAIIALDGGTNAVTVARNSSNIEGGTDNLTLDSTYNSITLVYSDASNGWVRQTRLGTDTFIEATGGTATTSGNYKIHTFNSSSNFVVSGIGNGSHTAEYLVVGGGAGGGNSNGGGGGAGGYRTNYPSPDTGGLAITAQTYPITVGSGGAGQPGPSTPGRGSDGPQSVFATITSTGGGGGGGGLHGHPNNPGQAGASGGGGATNGGSGGAGNTPPVSPSQGNAGGAGSPGSPHKAGGGGGASAVGTAHNGSPVNGAGGAGSSNSITGSAVAYSGGGGGGQANGSGSNPGTGGGGAGGQSGGNPGTAGSANKGGGGGGGVGPPGTSPGGLGGSGGSGVVIIRYKYQ